MKKILSTLSAAAMLVAAVALVGCSGAVQANPTDILEELEAPSVTAKAYPGFIRLTWDKVNGASQYKIYRNGELKATVNNGSKTAWNDIAGQNSNLINGKTYTYDVVAFAGDDYAYAQDSAASAASSAENVSARAVYVKQAKTTVTETANVPSVADFTENYKDYFEKFTAEDTALKTELVTVNNTNYIKVTAPTLPEFKYEASIELENTPANLISWNGLDAFEVESEDKTEFFRAVTGAGTYTVTVKVSPLSSLYSAKEFNGTKAEVKGLVISTGTSNYNATYISSTKVRIKWEPANASSVDYATTDYSVYRFDDGVYTKVTGDVAALKAGDINGSTVLTKKTYYIDDTVDASRPSTYIIVLGKNGLYEAAKYAYANNTLNQASSVSATATYINEGKAIRVKFVPAKKDDTVAMYTVYRYTDGETELVKLGDLKSTTWAAVNDASNSNYSALSYTTYFYAEDAVKDNTVTYSYKIYRTADDVTTNVANVNNVSAYNSSVSAAVPNALSAQVTVNDKDLLSNDVWVTFRLGNNTDTFKLYRANLTNTPNPLDSDYAAVNASAYYFNNTAYGLEYVYFDANLAKGSYRYKLVESEAGKKDSARTYDVNVNATSAASGFSVSWDSTNHKIIFSDSYNTKTETPANYTYAYQIVKKTTNDLNSYYVVADEALTAISLPDYGAADGGYQSKRAEVIKSITVSTTDTYQVIAVKTDSASGKKFYTATAFTASN